MLLDAAFAPLQDYRDELVAEICADLDEEAGMAKYEKPAPSDECITLS